MGTRTIKFTLSTDREGFLGRQCSDDRCRKYFKVKPGTGLTQQAQAFCPYCGHHTSEDQLHISNVHRWRASTSPLIAPGNPGFGISRLRSQSSSTPYGPCCGRCKRAIREAPSSR